MFKYFHRDEWSGLTFVKDMAKNKNVYIVGTKQQLIKEGVCKAKRFSFSAPESALYYYVYDCRRDSIVRVAETESDALIWIVNHNEEGIAS